METKSLDIYLLDFTVYQFCVLTESSFSWKQLFELNVSLFSFERIHHKP